ncbi:MAG: hypothetical protein IPL52_13405 [Flavobacteriales bacterium]|nr:hypothetical protein [Flavobacteriales bacterium]
MALRALHFSFVVAPALAVAQQQPFPTYADNGTWSVLQCLNGTGVWCQTGTYSYDGTDSMCGEAWSVYSWPTFGFPGVAYIRNEGQRTLMRRTSDCLDKEYVIYDFSMEVGDSVYAPMTMDILDPDTTLFILQAVDTVEILGVERRRFSLLFDPCNGDFANTPMEWIEGIGSTMHPFFPVDCLCDFCDQSFTLLCYDSAGVQLYLDPVLNTCDTLMTAIDEQGTGPTDGLQFIYDAAAGVLRVTAPDRAAGMGSELSLALITADGRIVVQHSLVASALGGACMDVSSVAPGAYAVVLSDGRKRIAGNRVVIE